MHPSQWHMGEALGCGSKLSRQGTAGFKSLVPFTMVPFWVPIFDPQPFSQSETRVESISGRPYETTLDVVCIYGEPGGKMSSR